jgi:DNA-binding NarL/FixJ family response regulator
MNIVIAEDHVMMRDVLSKACSMTFGHKVVAESSTGRDTLEAIALTRPDLLLLDLQLPDRTGFEIIESMGSAANTVKILILSSYCDDYTVYRVEHSNVDGFIDKHTGTIPILGQALETIGSGGRFYSEQFKTRSAHRRSNPKSFDKFLTPRERTILSMLSLLPTETAVAIRLGISIKTVETHKFNIFRKLEIRSSAELIRYANQHGFSHLSSHQALA